MLMTPTYGLHRGQCIGSTPALVAMSCDSSYEHDTHDEITERTCEVLVLQKEHGAPASCRAIPHPGVAHRGHTTASRAANRWAARSITFLLDG